MQKPLGPPVRAIKSRETTSLGLHAEYRVGSRGWVAAMVPLSNVTAVRNPANRSMASIAGKRGFGITPPPGRRRLGRRQREVLSLGTSGDTVRQMRCQL